MTITQIYLVGLSVTTIGFASNDLAFGAVIFGIGLMILSLFKWLSSI